MHAVIWAEGSAERNQSRRAAAADDDVSLRCWLVKPLVQGLHLLLLLLLSLLLLLYGVCSPESVLNLACWHAAASLDGWLPGQLAQGLLLPSLLLLLYDVWRSKHSRFWDYCSCHQRCLDRSLALRTLLLLLSLLLLSLLPNCRSGGG
jgi:hypothetical protein